MSSRGFDRPVLGHLHGVGEQLHRRLDPSASNSGSSQPTIWLDHWKIFFLSSCGTPISSAIACSGSSQATSVTKSPVPSASAVATIRSARSRRLSRMPRTAFGVKPRDTMPRTLVCSGGSMLSRITRCISIASLVDALMEPDQRGVLPAGVQVAAPGDLEDVGVPGHRPVAVVIEARGAAALGVPPDRGRPAQLGELLGRNPAGVEIRVGEVEARRDVRYGHDRLQVMPRIETCSILGYSTRACPTEP